MPPLPDSMRYPESGWWWLHAFSATVIFCWGWYHGQNRALRKVAEGRAKDGGEREERGR